MKKERVRLRLWRKLQLRQWKFATQCWGVSHHDHRVDSYFMLNALKVILARALILMALARTAALRWVRGQNENSASSATHNKKKFSQIQFKLLLRVFFVLLLMLSLEFVEFPNQSFFSLSVCRQTRQRQHNTERKWSWYEGYHISS